MKTVICEQEDCCRRAAEQILELTRNKPEAVLAFAAGRRMTPLFAELAALCDRALVMKDGQFEPSGAL